MQNASDEKNEIKLVNKQRLNIDAIKSCKKKTKTEKPATLEVGIQNQLIKHGRVLFFNVIFLKIVYDTRNMSFL